MLTALTDRRFVGRVFGGYRLEKVLGAGRFGTCFLAGGKEPAVMKLVKRRRGAVDMEAVWAECSALQACSHPGVPAWLGIVNEGPYFIVQGLMPGVSLARWLKEGRVFGMQEIRAIGLQLVGVLKHLEDRGIVHADIRPANVLYDGQRVSLIDFGLSSGGASKGSLAFAADRDGLASVLLFLLYSDQARIRPGVKATWREELILSEPLLQFLEDLFDEAYPWRGAIQVEERFVHAFA